MAVAKIKNYILKHFNANVKNFWISLPGIRIQENRVLFYVPILRIPVVGDNFYIFVTRLNENEAVLTVLTDLQTIDFYKMMRPR